MNLPLTALVLSAQALAFHVSLPARSSDCESSPVTPQTIADLQQLSGDWYGLYFWYNIADRQTSSLGHCPKVTLANASQEDIDKQKEICELFNKVDFDYDKVELIVKIENQKVLLAKGDEYYLGLYYCSYVGRIQFLKISDDAIIVNSPEEGGAINLMARNVPNDDELNRVVKNIAGIYG